MNGPRINLPGGAGANALVAVTGAVSVLAWIVLGFQAAELGVGFLPARFGTVDPLGGFLAMPALLTPFSYPLVHGGIIDLLFNLAILLLVGRFVEGALGWRMLLLLYVGGALAGAAVFFGIDRGGIQPLSGVMVPLSALIAAYAVLYGNNQERRMGILSPAMVRGLSLLLGWTLLTAAIAFLGTMRVTPQAVLPQVAAFAVGLLLARPMLAFRWRNA